MISYLEGKIKFKGPNYFILLINGIGYKVFVPTDILTSVTPNQDFSLFIYQNVKEDALDLYGFRTSEDLSLFELFLGISGIGPKTAIGIFGIGKIEKIKEAIVKGDVDFFTTVPRLGRKNAQKIIIELRPKLGNLTDIDLTEGSGETKEIIDALKAFGFDLSESREALKYIKDFEGSTSDKIRQILKYMGKK